MKGRRRLLRGLAAAALVPGRGRAGRGALATLAPWAGRSAAAAVDAEPGHTLRSLYPDRTPVPGPVRLEVPKLVENGNSVPLTLGVDPERFAAAEGPVELVLVLPRNPETFGARFRIREPGQPVVETRIRLAGTQNVTVAAAWPDGRLEVADQSVLVTLGACIDENYEDFL